jgi:lysozyme
MRTSRAGIDHITHFESSGKPKLKAYLCPAGIWTIGHGHTSAAGPPEVHQGMTITEAEALEIFRRDLRAFEAVVEKHVTAELTQGQFDALVDLVFNIGEENFRTSTLLRVLNQGQYDKVPAELMKWVKGRQNGQLVTMDGLVRRRRAACVLWRGIDDEAPVDVESGRVTPEPVPPPKTMATSKEGITTIAAGGGTAIELGNQVDNAMSSAGTIMGGVEKLVTNPRFYVLVVVIVAFGAFWCFRRQRLRNEGT